MGGALAPGLNGSWSRGKVEYQRVGAPSELVLVLCYGPDIRSRCKPVPDKDAVKRAFLTAFILLLTAGAAAAQTVTSNAAHRESHLALRPWSDEVFMEAKRDHRFILLDLEALWRHWYHVMDANTYSDPEVISLLQPNYITVKADQNPPPDLSNCREAYGRPETIILHL